MDKDNHKGTTEDVNVKVNDTLLALHHLTNTIGLVEGVDVNGEAKVDNPKGIYKTGLRFEPEADRFLEMYSIFYHQLKNPEEFSFFKVTEIEAEQTAEDLQQYINGASDEEKEELKDYSVSIDYIEAQREYIAKSQKDRYPYDAEQVDWKMMSHIGLTKKELENCGALDSLLKGYKTPMLIPVKINVGTVVTTLDARLSLQINNRGELEVRFHPIRKQVDFTKPFLGHHFSKEDQRNLLETGNMGRVVDLKHLVTGELQPSLISIDRLTKELIPLKTDWVRIPLVIKGVTLDELQKKTLQEGKPLYIENMLSKRGTLFNATVQFNTDKRSVEFLFSRDLKSLKSDLDSGFSMNVPSTFRGKKLRSWQVEKLNKGEVAYIDGLLDKSEKKYQGYLSFDKREGKFKFSFKNPNRKVEQKEKMMSKPKGRRL